MKRALADTGLPVFDIFSCYLEPETRIEHFTASLALGAELGGRFVMVMGNDTDFARMRDNFGLFCDEARRFDLTATVEFVPTRPLCTLAMTTRMIAEAGRDNAAVCIDPLHFTRTGGQPPISRRSTRSYFPTRRSTTACCFPGSRTRRTSARCLKASDGCWARATWISRACWTQCPPAFH
jgi:hypothetical protein